MFDGPIEAEILKIYGRASSFAEEVLSSPRAVHAFNLGPRMSARYDKYLQEAYKLGMSKNIVYGPMMGSTYFVMFAGMGLAFWQGITLLVRGEIKDIGTVFT